MNVDTSTPLADLLDASDLLRHHGFYELADSLAEAVYTEAGTQAPPLPFID